MVRAAQQKRPPLSHLKTIFPAENYVGIQLKIYGDNYKYQAEFKLPATGKNLHVGSFYSLAAACLAVNLMSYLVHGDGAGDGIYNRPPGLTSVVPPADFLRSAGADVASLRSLLRDAATAAAVAHALRKDLIKRYLRLHFGGGSDNPRDPEPISSHILAHLHSIKRRKESRLQFRSASTGPSDAGVATDDLPPPVSLSADHGWNAYSAALRQDHSLPFNRWPVLDATQEALRQWPHTERHFESSSNSGGATASAAADYYEDDDDDGHLLDDFVQLDPDFDIIMGAPVPPPDLAQQLQELDDFYVDVGDGMDGAPPERRRQLWSDLQGLDRNFEAMEGTSNYLPAAQPSKSSTCDEYGQLNVPRPYGVHADGSQQRQSCYGSSALPSFDHPSTGTYRKSSDAASLPAAHHLIRRVGRRDWRSLSDPALTSVAVVPCLCGSTLNPDVPIVSHSSYSVNGANVAGAESHGGGLWVLEGRFTCTNISYGVGGMRRTSSVAAGMGGDYSGGLGSGSGEGRRRGSVGGAADGEVDLADFASLLEAHLPTSSDS